MLKKEIRAWTLDFKRHQVGLSKDLYNLNYVTLNKVSDQGDQTRRHLVVSFEVLKQLHMFNSLTKREYQAKGMAKIRWQLRGTRIPNTFMLSLTKNRTNLSVKVIMEDGDVYWSTVILLNKILEGTFTDSCQDPGSRRGSLNFSFSNRLNNDQILELWKSPISNEDNPHSRVVKNYQRVIGTDN
ncbi:hypothetical protein Tco_0662139 [Tanacetum coccineum]